MFPCILAFKCLIIFAGLKQFSLNMLLKICVFLLAVHVSVEQAKNQDWDLAVTINDQIKLLTANGVVVGNTLSFTRLKALTFDNIRHQFIVSDMNEENDTIYSIPLKEGNNNVPIVQDLPDDIQGLAIDPLTDILYWTNPRHKSIHSIPLNDEFGSSEVFMKFEEATPQDIAIDSCRRYIYFTNSFSDRPSIDRIHLDTKQHDILIDSGLHTPVGIAIDYIAKKLYWSDSGPGIYFSIESANLEGKERDLLLTDVHQRPFGLAVDSEFIYWTDVNNNALWKRRKDNVSQEKGMFRVNRFDERPQGLVAKHLGFAGTPDCENIMQMINEYNESTTEYYRQVAADEKEKEQKVVCLNNGVATKSGCECPRGYQGPSCEIPLCHNYCLRGHCGFTSHGYPKCYCPTGYAGSRCENNICDNFCLNNGTCMHNSYEVWGVKCRCLEGFLGERCEINVESLCNKSCRNEIGDTMTIKNFMCVCKDSVEITTANDTDAIIAEEIKLSGEGIADHFKDPAFLILTMCLFVSLCVSSMLLMFVCKMKKRRPRVNKRIIVNKNVTPLTYRPQSTTQECEITIENCCNMNVCETPCFEPPQLRRKSAKDEKKTLLTNMEHPDELC